MAYVRHVDGVVAVGVSFLSLTLTGEVQDPKSGMPEDFPPALTSPQQKSRRLQSQSETGTGVGGHDSALLFSLALH